MPVGLAGCGRVVVQDRSEFIDHQRIRWRFAETNETSDSIKVASKHKVDSTSESQVVERIFGDATPHRWVYCVSEVHKDFVVFQDVGRRLQVANFLEGYPASRKRGHYGLAFIC